MKIRPEDYQRIKDEIRRAVKGQNKTIAEIFVEEVVRGHSVERICWGLFYATGMRIVQSHNVRNERDLPLYDYLEDSHINTALRRIVSELNDEGDYQRE